MISLRPKYLRRYKDIAWLLIKYGQSDLVKQAGLDEAMVGGDDGVVAETSAEAAQLADDLESLGPAFIKLGQLLSTRADLLPTPYLEALSRLQDDIEPFPFEEAERIISVELGVRMSRAFSQFDQTPIASGSLSQVHHATLRDGRHVAVKVQRPNIREQIVDDLDALGDLAELLDNHTEAGRRYEFRRLLDTLRKTLLRELDFRNEAHNFRKLAHHLQDFPSLMVPRPVDQYTSAHVLTMDYIPGLKITTLSPAALIDIDGEKLAEEIFRAYLHQVLVDGFFHADPHPGNLLMLEDGRIALLDLGMMVQVTPKLQENLFKLLLCIAEGRGEDAANVAVKMGKPRLFFQRAEFRDRISHLVVESRDASLERMKLGHVVLEIVRAAGETGIRLPEEFMMLSKTLLNLEKVLSTLDPAFHLATAMRRHATDILRQRGESYFSLGKLYQSLLEVNEFAVMLPERVNKIMDLVAENELKVHVDAIDERKLIQGLYKIANRITTGILLAALIVGASLMMHVETTLTVFGYPAIAMFFFLAAGAGALILTYQALFHDPKDEHRP